MQELPNETKLIEGQYILEAPLASGSFGTIYKGCDIRLGRQIAIKEFTPPGSFRDGLQVLPGSLQKEDFERARDKFIEEASVLAKFDHHNIVRIYNCFEENNTAYMVMEYLEGQTLQNLIENTGIQPEPAALNYIEQICGALRVIHQANLIHRDINPANIILCKDGRVVLIDFGLNWKLEEAGAYQTRALRGTAPLGTPSYAPLEQYSISGQLGAFTDIYALGATLYYLLTAKAPMDAPQRVNSPLTPPHQVNSRISFAVSDAVMRAMAMGISERPQQVEELLQLLKRNAQQAQPNSSAVKQSKKSPPTTNSSTPVKSPSVANAPTKDPDLWQQSIKAILHGHGSGINRLLFSPDSRMLVSSSEDRTVRIWMPETLIDVGVLESYRVLDGFQKNVYTFAFSPDGTKLTTAAGDEVRLWRTASWRSDVIGKSKSVVRALAFSPNGQCLATCDPTIKLWDTTTWRISLTNRFFKTFQAEAQDLHFCPDGKSLALSDGTIKVYDTSSWRLLHTIPSHRYSFSPDGRMCAVIDFFDDRVKLLDTTTWRCIRDLGKDKSKTQTSAMALGPRQLACGKSNGTIQLWDIEKGGYTLTESGEDDPIGQMAYSGSGKWLAYSHNGKTTTEAGTAGLIWLWSCS